MYMYLYINERHTQEKQIFFLAWCTHSFINNLNEFAKFCKLNFVFGAH